MNIKIKSISFKVSLLYIFLAVINMSFFSMMIYENQIDLITENTKYHVEKLTSSIISSLKNFSSEMKSKKIFRIKNEEDVVKEIANIIGKNAPDYIIFKEDGKIINKSRPDLAVSKSDILNGIKAVTNMDFTGKPFYSNIDGETYEISFYIPFKLYLLDESILFLKFKIKDIGERLSDLYRLITIIIIIIAVFHVLFAMILFRLLIMPIKSLHKKSLEISSGDLSARSDIKQEDEIGELGKAFNSMADSIQEKITALQKQNELMDYELNIAGEVQKIIFPKLENNELFNYSVYHRAMGKVSGDYYDIFPLGDSRFGFLIVDVSGHGVPAALITMIAKEIFKRHAPNYNKPSELFQHVNLEITDILGTHDEYSGLYFTAFYLIVDENNLVSYCKAGHLDPLLIRMNKKKISALDTNGFFIGISKDINRMYETKTTRLESGDKIVLFTDGIVEAKDSNEEAFGINRFIESIKKSYLESGDKIMNTIIDDLGRFTNIDEIKDDATIFIIEVK